MPPNRITAPPDPNAPIFGRGSRRPRRITRTIDDSHGLVGHGVNALKRQQTVLGVGDVMKPPYAIDNAVGRGVLSDRTAYVTVLHPVQMERTNKRYSGERRPRQRPRDVRHS